MRKEFMVERQGRGFCLYAGLLDLAHQQGLKSITTDIVQIPTEANNRVAICTATVVLEKDGVERVFTGIGDAAPNNVAPAMQTCLLRMSETRAKARAIRDAVNIGVAAFEELGDEQAHDGAPEQGYRTSSRPPAARSTRQTTPCPECHTIGVHHRPRMQQGASGRLRANGRIAYFEVRTEELTILRFVLISFPPCDPPG